jgi:hypothetical protein
LQNQRLIELFHVPKEIAEDDDDSKMLRHVTAQMKNPEQFFKRVEQLYAHPDKIGRDEIELANGMTLAWISHLVCNPRTAWVVFVIFCLLPGFARHFSSPPLVFARRGRCFDAIVGSKAHFLPAMKTPPPLLPWFSCDSFHFSSSGCCCW